MKEGAEVKDFEGIFNILSKNDTFPVIDDIYEHCHPEKKLITSVIAVFSDKKTEVAAEHLILEEKNNCEKLKDFSDVVKNIFTKCGLLESAKNGNNISVRMNDEIPGSGPERKLMDLFIAYYLYLVSNNPAKYIGKLYRKLTFIDSDDSGETPAFSLEKYQTIRSAIKHIILLCHDSSTGMEICKFGESTYQKMLDRSSFGVYVYLRNFCSHLNGAEIKKILEGFVSDIDFNIEKMSVDKALAGTNGSETIHVETGSHKKAIRSAMLEYQKSSDKNPEVKRFLRSMALAVYAESLEMKKWLKYTDLQEFTRQFKPKTSS